jgi:hypothetical protein
MGWTTRLMIRLTMAVGLVLAVSLPAAAHTAVDPIESGGLFGPEVPVAEEQSGALFGPEGPVLDYGSGGLFEPEVPVGSGCSMGYILETDGQYVCSNSPFTVQQPDGSTVTVGQYDGSL